MGFSSAESAVFWGILAKQTAVFGTKLSVRCPVIVLYGLRIEAYGVHASHGVPAQIQDSSTTLRRADALPPKPEGHAISSGEKDRCLQLAWML